MHDNREFQPTWLSPPGNTIADILERDDCSIEEFSEKLGCSVDFAKRLLVGRVQINPNLARQLAAAIGATAEFWVVRDAQYRADLTRNKSGVGSEMVWLDEIPHRDMSKFGWIVSQGRTIATAKECLDFFDVPDVPAWVTKYAMIDRLAAFRMSPALASRAGAVAAWLRKAEIEAEKIQCRPWSSQQFRQLLGEIKSLTRQKLPEIFLPKLQGICALAGVAVVVVRAPSGCRASGATRFLSRKKALLVLSFRHLTDDHFWFTFFHEAGHLILHGQDAFFLESPGMLSTGEEEEANDFASGTLVPEKLVNELRDVSATVNDIIRFAVRAGVSSGIIVGQLQHMGKLRRNQMNSLKRRYKWAIN